MNLYKDKTKPNTFSSAALGCGVSLISALILTAVFAAVASFTKDPRSFSWLGRAVLFICAALAGFTGAKLSGEAPFPAGLLAGAMYIAVIVIASLISPGKTVFWYIPISLGVSAVFAVIGSIRRDKGSKIPSFDSKKYDFGQK